MSYKCLQFLQLYADVHDLPDVHGTGCPAQGWSHQMSQGQNPRLPRKKRKASMVLIAEFELISQTCGSVSIGASSKPTRIDLSDSFYLFQFLFCASSASCRCYHGGTQGVNSMFCASQVPRRPAASMTWSTTRLGGCGLSPPPPPPPPPASNCHKERKAKRERGRKGSGGKARKVRKQKKLAEISVAF